MDGNSSGIVNKPDYAITISGYTLSFTVFQYLKYLIRVLLWKKAAAYCAVNQQFLYKDAAGLCTRKQPVFAQKTGWFLYRKAAGLCTRKQLVFTQESGQFANPCTYNPSCRPGNWAEMLIPNWPEMQIPAPAILHAGPKSGLKCSCNFPCRPGNWPEMQIPAPAILHAGLNSWPKC